MSEGSLRIERIDACQQEVVDEIVKLRRRLSSRGDVVSQESRQRTIEVFGEPLSPAQVVERMCVLYDGPDRGSDFAKELLGEERMVLLRITVDKVISWKDDGG